ncbi:PAS domain-containing protein [Alteromonas sp. ASW11-130]|uniref:PAS domain-containing protein n=1 Tax=Alteromonas sp. ASW11-130 TaxID=3015775 RepID=UPI002242BD86|nr:PAS domain-containing protein [Alteromonas sp. ASW11-130]MCW8093179.1 PAS domain-containing protein [Alteromonas sp. ASW11-130]
MKAWANRLIAQISSLFTLSVLTSPAYAGFDELYDFVAQRPQFASYVGIITTGILAFLVLILLIKQFVTKRRLASLAAVSTTLQAQLNALPSGALFISKTGDVLAANRTALYLLGIKEENVNNVNLLSLLPNADEPALKCAFASAKETRIQCTMPRRDRVYQVRVCPNIDASLGAHAAVMLEDVHLFQQTIDNYKNHLSHLTTEIGTSGHGVITIDYTIGTVEINSAVATWVNAQNSAVFSPDEMSAWFSEPSWQSLHSALMGLGECQQFELLADLNEANEPRPVRVLGSVIPVKGAENASCVQLILIDLKTENNYKNQLQSALKLHHQTTSIAPFAIYRVDTEGTFLEGNLAFGKLVGADVNKYKGKPFSTLPTVNEDWAKAHQGELGSMPVKVTLNPQEKVFLTLHMQKMSSPGLPVSIIAIVHNQSEEVAANAAKYDAETKLTSLVDCSPSGIVVMDEKFKVVEVNQTLVTQLGYEVTELTGVAFHTLFNDKPSADQVLSRVERHERCQNAPVKLRTQDERSLDVTLNISKLSEVPCRYIAWLSDREEQRYLNSRFDRLVNYASIPMAIVEDDAFTRLNAAACAFFDIDDEQSLLGKTLHSNDLNKTDDNANFLRNKLDAAKAHGQALTLNWQHHYQQKALPCEITLIPVFKGTELSCILCLWVDLRALKEANAARAQAQQLRNMAQQEVERKDAELSSSQDALAKKHLTLTQTEHYLAKTQTELTAVQGTLTDKLSTLSALEEAHQTIRADFANLQQEYKQNQQWLDEAKTANRELEDQLNHSSEKVTRLEAQRHQIANALQYSEKQYRQTQQQLDNSRMESEKLKQAQEQQTQVMAQSEQKIAALKSSLGEKDTQLQDINDQIQTLYSQLQSSVQAKDALREQLINQRKASEKAENERRSLQESCERAQTELAAKARQIDHLQNEMQALEAMSNQSKDEMEAHQQRLESELLAKEAQLDASKQDLAKLKQQSEAVQIEKQQKQEALDRLVEELNTLQAAAEEQQHSNSEAQRKWHKHQLLLLESLRAKESQLKESEAALHHTIAESEAEKAEKARQQQELEELRAECEHMQEAANTQQQYIVQNEQEWKTTQQHLARSLEAKQAELSQAQKRLEDHQQQVAAEKRAKEEQQQRLAQLEAELADVAQRAETQKAMMEGSDEQWRKHRQEIEAQKAQLHAALESAKQENTQMQEQLQTSQSHLVDAESKVSQTHSEEQKLNQELNSIKADAEALQQQLTDKQANEEKLQQQIQSQHNTLQQREESIATLKEEQSKLERMLKLAEQECAQAKDLLSSADADQSDLQRQLAALEHSLDDSKLQLAKKEQALNGAQQKIQQQESQLQQQASALVEAQKAQLHHQHNETPATNAKALPGYANFEMPLDSSVWFDLLPYLQANKQVDSLAVSLKSLLSDLEHAVEATSEAISNDDRSKMLVNTRKLIALIRPVNSAPLNDMANRLEADIEHGNLDNISIFWPTARQNLSKTMRVIYGHLND